MIANQVAKSLALNGIFIKTGPYVSCLNSSISNVSESLLTLYHNSQISLTEEFADFRVSINYPNVLRRWVRPQVLFKHNEVIPFKPLPASQAYPFFEWGLNWCIATHSNFYLILHAAVVEKNGCALILPAMPGSGKSTLAAGLSACGWRLLSDEMALCDPQTEQIIPVVRPISLKNESIDVIKYFAPEFVFGSIIKDTTKGTVTHAKVPCDLSVIDRPAMPTWLVFPKFEKGSKTSLVEISKAKAFFSAAENSFNYNVLAETGFRCLANLIDACDCYNFLYSDLNQAVKVFDRLADEKKQ